MVLCRAFSFCVYCPQHSDDDETIGLRIDACLKRGEPSSWGDFLDSSGLVEKETLNDVARRVPW